MNRSSPGWGGAAVERQEEGGGQNAPIEKKRRSPSARGIG